MEEAWIETFPSREFLLLRTESPFVVGYIDDFGDRVLSCQHHIPHFPYEGESLGIDDNGLFETIVEVSDRSGSGESSSFPFSL